jgi:hypothetical protein
MTCGAGNTWSDADYGETRLLNAIALWSMLGTRLAGERAIRAGQS